MKTRLLIFFLLLQFIVNGQSTYISSCNGSDSLKKELYRDAFILSLDRIYEIKSPDTAFVLIPKVYIDSILDKLIAIHNLNIGTTDTIFNYYSIHSIIYYSEIPNLIICFDTTKTWKTNWKKNITLTGDPSIDNSIIKYSLALTTYDTTFIKQQIVAWFKSDSILNYKALTDSLETIDGIDSVLLFYPPITFTPNMNNYLTYENNVFSFSAFDSKYEINTWSFKVDDNCSVTYLGKDIKLSVNENPNTKEISVYPNPFNSEINICTNNAQTYSYKLYDITGKLAIKGNFNTNCKINVTTLKNGFYTIEITNGNKKYIKKIIK